MSGIRGARRRTGRTSLGLLAVLLLGVAPMSSMAGPPDAPCGSDSQIAAELRDKASVGRSSLSAYGWKFKPNQDIKVTHIGLWEGLEPLPRIRVEFLNVTKGTVLFDGYLEQATTTLDGPTNALYDGGTGQFRYKTLDECIEIAGGDECRLFAWTLGTVICFGDPLSTATEIDYLGSAFSSRPTWWGPNFQFIVPDTTPPTITVKGLPATLWPPNHKMVRIRPTVTATDDQDPNLTLALEVTSSEPDDGLGDGDTSGDAVIHSPTDVELRAERSGTGTGRTYTLKWTATDAAGNTSTYVATVKVPKSKHK